MKKNLGAVDAASVGLDFRACIAGNEVDVNDKAATWLVGRNLADPVQLKAVPKAPEALVTMAPEPIVAPVIEDKPEPKQEQPVVSAPRPVLSVKKSKEK